MAALRLPSSPQRPRVPVADSLSSIILERALDISAILALSAVFGFLALGARWPRWLLASYAIAAALLAVFAVTLLLVPALLDSLRRWSDHRLWRAALDFTQQFVASLRTLPRRPRLALGALIASLYIWLCDAAVLWLVVAALGVRLPLAQAGFVALTADIFAAVPLTPGGMGQVEAAYAALLALLAAAPFSVPAAILVTRAITYWSFLLFSGLVTFGTGLGGVLARQPAAPESGAESTHSRQARKAKHDRRTAHPLSPPLCFRAALAALCRLPPGRHPAFPPGRLHHRLLPITTSTTPGANWSPWAIVAYDNLWTAYPPLFPAVMLPLFELASRIPPWIEPRLFFHLLLRRWPCSSLRAATSS